ncbi:hypothetical protein PMAYCL1PPCAC_09652, partial [Pristionchus mayeri]
FVLLWILLAVAVSVAQYEEEAEYEEEEQYGDDAEADMAVECGSFELDSDAREEYGPRHEVKKRSGKWKNAMSNQRGDSAKK